MQTEAVLRPFVWELMGQLEQQGLGSRQRLSDQRDRFDLEEVHPAAGILSEQPRARGFIRADRDGLLFRNASEHLRAAIPSELGNRAMPSAKGLEFRWTQLTHGDIRRLFNAIMQIGGAQPAADFVDAPDAPAVAPIAPAVPPASLEFTYEFEQHGVDPSLALIYLWEVIGGSGDVLYRYVGKAKNGSGRPIEHYRRNILNLLQGKPYRRGKPYGYRAVHRRLAEAVRAGERVRLRLICNLGNGEDINEVERHWQRYYGCYTHPPPS